MKTTLNTLLMAIAAWLFCSCATTGISSASAGDDIYYRPSQAQQTEIIAQNAELVQLKARTSAAVTAQEPAPATTYTRSDTGDDVVYVNPDTKMCMWKRNRIKPMSLRIMTIPTSAACACSTTRTIP